MKKSFKKNVHNYMDKNPKANAAAIAKHLGITKTTAYRHMKSYVPKAENIKPVKDIKPSVKNDYVHLSDKSTTSVDPYLLSASSFALGAVIAVAFVAWIGFQGF